MSIAYNFEVVTVDQAARVMEVVYTSEGRQTMRIGARLPYAGETLEAVIAMYAPVAYWLEQDAVVQNVQVGASGAVTPAQPDMSLQSVKNRKKAEIAAARLSFEVSGVTVSGVRVLTDRESQAILTGAYATLKAGLVESLDWKAADGSFVTITTPEALTMAQVVANHVQASFATERELVAQIDAATTEQQVAAVTWPR
jgi:hypothetical protein